VSVMNVGQPRRAAFTLVILAVAICGGACKGGQGRTASPDSVQAAVTEIRQMVRNMDDHPDGTASQAHAIRSMQEALKGLNGKSSADVHGPRLVVAELGTVTAVRNGVSLRLQWIDPEADATGLYVLDAGGRERRFENVMRWDDETRRLIGQNALTRAGFPVFADEKTTGAWDGVDHFWPPLKLDLQAVKAGAKVGLITKSGQKTKAIELFVDPVMLKPLL